MKSKFYRPNIIWFGVWMAICCAMLIIGSWQKDLYRQADENKFKQVELVTVSKVLPYALAYLEEQKRADLLVNLINVDLGPYAVVITDKARKIKFLPTGLSADNGANFLKGKEFFYLIKSPAPSKSLEGPYLDGSDSTAPPAEAEVLGRLYLVAKNNYSFTETPDQTYWKILTPSEVVFAYTLLSYAMVLVGFAGICAITARFQSHFQQIEEKQFESELEAQELRIQVLESDIKAAQYRVQLLDRTHVEAQAKLDAAQGTIAGLEVAIKYESSRNEELCETLSRAEADRNEAVETMQAIEQDQERIGRELKELEALREVEEMNRPDPSKEKSRRPKEFLWLNLVYKNLHFSRRALQNIIDLQNSPDVFPSLPDALASLNNSSVESLLAGESIPSRSVVKYSQSLAHHTGDLWEYRFSKDGRIFFGLSKSKTWNIDTILLKRKFTENRYKYEKFLDQTLGKDNEDLKTDSTIKWREYIKWYS